MLERHDLSAPVPVRRPLAGARLASGLVVAVTALAGLATPSSAADRADGGYAGAAGPAASAPDETTAEPTAEPTAPTTAPATARTTTARTAPRPWPNAKNTGAHGKLRVISGRTIRRDGAVLRNVEVRGQVTIYGDDVTLDNVYVKTDSYYGVLVYGRRAKVLDTTIQGTPGPTLSGLTAYEKGSFVARRIHVFGSEDGVRMADNCVLARSFIHGLAGHKSSHYDSVTADGYRGWRIVNNRILNHHDQTAAVWVGDPRYKASAGLLQGNLIAGGGYSIYGGPGAGKGIRVLDNKFSTRFHPRSGYWGPVAHWERANNTWARNTWVDGRREGRRVTP